MTIKFIIDRLKTEDREELEKIIEEIKAKPYKPGYPKEAKILKKFILAILKSYQTPKTELARFPSKVRFKIKTPIPIKFNLAKTLNVPNKIKFNIAPEKINL